MCSDRTTNAHESPMNRYILLGSQIRNYNFRYLFKYCVRFITYMYIYVAPTNHMVALATVAEQSVALLTEKPGSHSEVLY